jgi:hypothetical protein
MFKNQGDSDMQSLSTMKTRFLYRSPLFRLPLLRRYRAICLGRWVVCRDSESDVSEELRAHELVHQEQMDRHGIPAFYTLYLADYLRNLWKFRDHDRAYRGIRFEQEAYARTQALRRPG